MNDDTRGCSRRQFFRIAGAAGLGTLVASRAQAALPKEVGPTLAAGEIAVPKRPFGKSGIDVSILGLGGMFDIAANQLMLQQAVRWGVTYWDTADCYHRGSEAGIGKYFAKYPEQREKIFLVTKSDARDPEGIEELLERSLERMNTSYIDLYFIHGISTIRELDQDTRKWAEKAKARNKIRLFGFSTHRNMERCLTDAAKLGWVDGIMFSYNFRNMHTEEMQAAVAACVQAGIGLTAMKTQAGASLFSSDGVDLQKHFMAKGFTEEQAKLKAVWTNPHIASICSQMDSMKLLKVNAAAAGDPISLSSADLRLLQRHAGETARNYCAGCGHICEGAVGLGVPISDVMRYHMYCRSYGRSEWAREQFQALDTSLRRRMATADYTEAERRCPNRLPIAQLMHEALETYL